MSASVGSLCSGFTGLDMGLALGLGTNLRHAWHVENAPAPAAILAYRYPGIPNYGDLKTLDYALMEPVDWITAGYPCQPFSDAGLRLGEADPRHLWAYVADTISALRPRGVLLENVRGHLRRGLSTVLADLAALGYDATWGVVRASDAGAPHRRERVFVVAKDAGRPAPTADQAPADPRGERRERGAHLEGTRWSASERSEASGDPGDRRGARPEAVADADRGGRKREPALEAPQRADVDRRVLDWSIYEPAVRRWERITGRDAPWATEPRGRGGTERLSPRFVEWLMGVPDGWVVDVPGLSANDQLAALGNGVVPPQAALAISVLRHNLSIEEAVA